MKRIGILCFVLLCSCSVTQNRKTVSSSALIHNTIENEYGSFDLAYASDTYNFIDEIEITLNLSEGIFLPENLPEEGTEWGDFLVRKKIVHSHESCSWILLPEKIGQAELTPLSLLLTTRENEPVSVSFSPIQLNIKSVLKDDSGELEDLIVPEMADSADSSVWIPVLAASLMGILLIIGYFFYLREKKRKRDPEEPFSRDILESCSDLINLRDFNEKEIKDQYRQVYYFLAEFLHALCPSIPKGLDPSALIIELERPSSLNQWALRTLYPVLKEMEEIFFNPGVLMPSGTIKKGHFNTILECMVFLEKEEGKPDV